MTVATWQQVIVAAPASFLLGLFVGWIVSQHYAIVHRREPENGRRSYDKPEDPQ